MRTNKQQEQDDLLRTTTMIRQIKAVARRSQDTLLADALGMMAIVTALVVGLYMPGFL